MKTVLIIIAPENYQEKELLDTKEALEKNGIRTKICSTVTGNIQGKSGGTAVSEIALNKVEVNDYDAVAVIGGPGALQLKKFPEFFSVLTDFKNQNKILSGICIAPVLLAQGGFLKDKKATVWNSDSLQGPAIESFGAVYQNKPVVKDGDIITANGPLAATAFGEMIANALK